VSTINISIGHNNDFMVSKFFNIILFFANTTTKRCN